jgi:signal transduction histidine kinase
MFKPFTILKKAILIVSIPVLAQAIFIGMLLESMSEGATAQKWAVHTKDVIAKTEESYRLLMGGYAGVRNLMVLEQPIARDPFINDLSRVSGALSELRQLVADNPAQQAKVDNIAARARAISGQLASIAAQLAAGQRDQAARGLDEAALAIAGVRKEIDDMLAQESRLDMARMTRMRRSNSWHFWILIAGGGAILAMTVLVALVFFQRVVRRLEILTDNSRRLAEGKPLNRPLTGGDELAALDRAFRETASSLLEQRKENEMFVYSVSHDLRSPLINLQGFSGELKLAAGELGQLFDHPEMPPALRDDGRKLITGPVTESVTFLRAAVDRLARIIDSLLRLSRAGRVQFEWQLLEVSATVQKVVDALRDSIKSKRAEITVLFLPTAWGDPTAVEQIFGNLLDNAVRYLDPARPGRIEVGSVPPDWGDGLSNLHVYYVKDNGFGIPLAYQDRIFTAFNRLHPDAAQGEGVGLVLVSRMVERLGGRIWLESSAGTGTTFFVALPARPLEGVQFSRAHKISELQSAQEGFGHDTRTNLDRVGRR